MTASAAHIAQDLLLAAHLLVVDLKISEMIPGIGLRVPGIPITAVTPLRRCVNEKERRRGTRRENVRGIESVSGTGKEEESEIAKGRENGNVSARSALMR